jgi:tRNA(Phe) wybutosine-synthesizing methylase Tyw3
MWTVKAGSGRESVLQCEETKEGATTRWVWMTDLEVNRRTVIEVAQRGGRKRWCAQNEGFNTQKKSEMKLEHAYSEDESGLKVYYLLLQMAHLMLQLLEKGSLLLRLAREQGKSVLGLFGSVKNRAKRLRDSFVRVRIQDEAYSVEAARKMQIRLAKADSS